uniref:Zinc finger protein 865 n=1 Tax=Timema shepardi TaxID=629360 RepID=A0A7R9G2L0_TIMSH|nr:unnamed protein product [Timema shepardi]
MNTDMTRPSSTEVHVRTACIYPSNVCKKRKDGVKNSMINVKDKAYESPECGKVSVTKQSLKYHQITHSNLKSHTSLHCGQQFCEVSAVSRNIHTSHGAESDFECNKCIKTFLSKIDHDNHLKIPFLVRPFFYDAYGKPLSDKMTLHSDKTKIWQGTSIFMSMFDANHTLARFASKLSQQAWSYAEIKTSILMLSCMHVTSAVNNSHNLVNFGGTFVWSMRDEGIMCATSVAKPSLKKFLKITTCASTLNEHVLKTHISLHTGAQPRPCSHCDKAFFFASSLKQHMKQEHGEFLLFKCDVCGKTFNLKCHLKSHNETHNHDKIAPILHICQMCGKTFKKLQSLKIHEKQIHLGVPKQHICECCGAMFHNISKLKLHMLRHTGDRPFTCEACGLRFGTKHRLNNHLVCHSEERPHTCGVCGKTFKRQRNLGMHEQNSHGIFSQGMGKEKVVINFPCQVCDKQFTTKHKLAAHMRNHTGERPFTCETCGREYKTAAGLGFHTKTSHMVWEGKPMSKYIQDAIKKDFPCKICGKVLSSRVGREHHIRTHTGERPYKCKLCELALKTPAQLHAHMQIHSDSKPFPCTYCDKTFRRRPHLVSHLRTHTGEKPYPCEVCGRAFSQKGDMKKHQESSTEENIKFTPNVCDVAKPDFTQQYSLFHACDKCGKIFLTEKLLKVHLKIHLQEPVKCNLCGRVYKNERVLDTHMSLHKEAKPWPCNYCDKVFIFDSSLQEHIKSDHEPDNSNKTTPNVYTCQICEIKFDKLEELKSHLMSTHKHLAKRHICEFCGAMYHTSNKLKTHLLKHTGEFPFTCEVCGMRFCAKYRLNNHLVCHVDERPHICSVCGWAFKRLRNLRAHEQDSHGIVSQGPGNKKSVANFSCQMCEWQFTSKKRLDSHMSVHTGLKPFPCEICGSAYATPSKLSFHKKTMHSGLTFRKKTLGPKKPFLCSTCGKVLTSNLGLELHMRTHTGERPYECKVCKMAIKTPSQLHGHMQTHSDIRPYTCSICNKSFRRRPYLLSHLRTHTGEKPHPCSVCGSDMKKHKKTVHKIPETDEKTAVTSSIVNG